MQAVGEALYVVRTYRTFRIFQWPPDSASALTYFSFDACGCAARGCAALGLQPSDTSVEFRHNRPSLAAASDACLPARQPRFLKSPGCETTYGRTGSRTTVRVWCLSFPWHLRRLRCSPTTVPAPRSRF